MNSSIVIIGGLGFIGKNLINTLLDKNAISITVIDKTEKLTSLDFSSKEVHFIDANGDITKALLEAEIVIDLSYSTNPMTSFESPTNDITSNLPRSVSLFKLLTQSNRLNKLIVVSSGGTVYGDQSDFPISELATTNPLSPYGITKLAIEKYALMYHEISKLPVVILRPANAYGPGQMPFLGQGFIANAIANALNKTPVVVFGKEGTIRDYIFISDLTSAIEHAIVAGKIGEAYNIGSEIGHSNNDIIKRLEKIMKDKILVENKPERAFDVKKNILSSKKLQNHTGWKPTISLDEGLISMLNWIKEKI